MVAKKAMDWYSWLSKSGLDSSLVYDYSQLFANNELQIEDLVHFNHEFLQSMGISVAKHRLQILKLAKKECPTRNGLSRLVMATRKLLTQNMGKWASRRGPNYMNEPELSPYQLQWTGALRKHIGGSGGGGRVAAVVVGGRSMMRSGPMDRRMQERVVVGNRSLSLSGPLDGKAQERPMFMNWSPYPVVDGRVRERLPLNNRSPNVSGPLDGKGLSPKIINNYNKQNGDGVQSLWSLMFNDMNPT